MKKLGVVMLAVVMLFSAVPAMADDTMFDKMGDWFATVGKSQPEKDQIILQRKMDRAAKKTGDAFKKAGKDLEQAFK